MPSLRRLALAFQATRLTLLGLLLPLFLLAACASPAATPTPVPPAAPAAASTPAIAATTAPAPAVGATSAPAAAAAAATAAPTPQPTVAGASATPGAAATPSGSGVATPAAAATAPAGSIRFVFGNGTEARYRVTEQLAGRDLPSDAVGSTNSATGAIVLQPDGTIVPGQSKITVDLTTLKTDVTQRDNFVRRNVLETSTYPTAVFVPTKITGLPAPLPTSEPAKFQITGDLTIHGVTRPTTWDVTTQPSGQNASGTAATSFKFADFGMTQPRVPVVLSVQDNIRLELDFQLSREGAA